MEDGKGIIPITHNPVSLLPYDLLEFLVQFV